MFRRLSQRRITISMRIFMGFGIVLLLLLAQTLVSNLGFDAVRDRFTDYGEANRSVREMQAMQRNLLDHQRGVLAYTYSGYEGLVGRVRELAQLLSRQVGDTRPQARDADETKLLREMDAQLKLYAGHFEDAIAQRKLREDLAFAHLVRRGEGALEELEGVRVSMLAGGDGIGAELASHAQTQLALVQRDALRFLLRPNSALTRATHRHLERLSEALNRLVQRRREGVDEEISSRLGQMSKEFQAIFNGMVQASRAYMHLVYVVMGGEAARIGYLARRLEESSIRDQTAVEGDMSASVGATRLLILLGSVLTVLLGLYLAWRISRGISSPIEAMTGTLSALALGRMESEIPGQGRGDEIGAMAMAAQVFKEKAHELENASRYKSEFLANMSHELRTPLNSMLILAKVLAKNEEGRLSADQVESAEVIHESGTGLLRLINDILDLSKVEAGHTDLHVQEKSFSDFKRTLERLFQPVAEQKGLAFSVELHPKLPTVLRTDWDKLEQIVRNLLSNALKFTAEGSVGVWIGPPRHHQIFMHSELSVSDCLSVTVQDTGIGIPEDKHEQIFEAFQQVDGTTRRKHGGTGLGLAISRRFAEMLGGEIQVESREGEGARVSLFLPLHFPEAAESRAGSGGTLSALHADGLTRNPADAFEAQSKAVLVVDAASFERERGAALPGVCGPSANAATRVLHRDLDRAPGVPPIVVLIVDDDMRDSFSLARTLQKQVARVLVARDGDKALEHLKRDREVSIVLMDISMPDLDGCEAIRAIRRLDAAKDIPVIALTAEALPEGREKCLAAGADDCLGKPVEPGELLEKIHHWLHARVRAGRADPTPTTETRTQ